MYTENCHSSNAACPCPDDAPPKTQSSLLSLILLPPRAIAASLYGAADIFRKTLEGAYADSCSLCDESHPKHQDCCEIPETCCPSPYVCKIHWVGCPGDTLQYHVQVINTGKIKREFNLTAQPFPCSEEVVKVTPNKKVLAPDESLKAVVSFTIPTSFGGGHYLARIKVAGAYEQYIVVSLHVKPHQQCCCVIEQGEIPKRIKAHHWYHHFQCEEPCFDAVVPEQGETTPRPTPPRPGKPVLTSPDTKRKEG
jgi:hypothetical protein